MENNEIKLHQWFDLTRKPVTWLCGIFDMEGMWKEVACLHCAQAEEDKEVLLNYIREFKKILEEYEKEIKEF